MTTPKLLRQLTFGASLLLLIARHPTQARNLRTWRQNLRRPPAEARLAWLPFDVMTELESRLSPTAQVFEFGSGGSTLWFADRAGRVTSIEHSEAWYHEVVARVEDDSKCDLRYVEAEERRDGLSFATYADTILSLDDDSLDVVLIDGPARMACLRNSIQKVRPGGALVLDDSSRVEYRAAFEMLSGWQRQDFAGLAPSKAIPAHTTMWWRPVESAVSVAG